MRVACPGRTWPAEAGTAARAAARERRGQRRSASSGSRASSPVPLVVLPGPTPSTVFLDHDPRTARSPAACDDPGDRSAAQRQSRTSPTPAASAGVFPKGGEGFRRDFTPRLAGRRSTSGGRPCGRVHRRVAGSGIRTPGTRRGGAKGVTRSRRGIRCPGTPFHRTGKFRWNREGPCLRLIRREGGFGFDELHRRRINAPRRCARRRRSMDAATAVLAGAVAVRRARVQTTAQGLPVAIRIDSTELEKHPDLLRRHPATVQAGGDAGGNPLAREPLGIRNRP